MTETRPPSDGWHLDKRVPIGIIGAIILQTFAIGWWVASMENRITYLEKAASNRMDERDRLIVLETELRAVNATLQRIERRLDADDLPSRR